MTGDQNGAPFRQYFQFAEEVFFCIRVQVRGRFIEQENRGIAQQGAGKGNALALAA